MVGKGEPGGPVLRDGDEETAGFVKLISAEGFEFVVHKKAAMVSNTLRNMLTSPGGFSETRHGEVRFPQITTHILEKTCQYFYWSLHYSRDINMLNDEWFADEEKYTILLAYTFKRK